MVDISESFDTQLPYSQRSFGFSNMQANCGRRLAKFRHVPKLGRTVFHRDRKTKVELLHSMRTRIVIASYTDVVMFNVCSKHVHMNTPVAYIRISKTTSVHRDFIAWTVTATAAQRRSCKDTGTLRVHHVEYCFINIRMHRD